MLTSSHYYQSKCSIPLDLSFWAPIFFLIPITRNNILSQPIYKCMGGIEETYQKRDCVKQKKMIIFDGIIQKQILQFKLSMDQKGQFQHPYANVNPNRNPEELMYDTAEIQWGQMNNYVVHRKLGRGKYSHVLQGTDKRNNKPVAIKVLLPIRKQKIKREYHLLKQLDHPNIIKLKDIVKCSHLKTTSLVMEYFPHQDFRDLYPKLTLSDIKLYMSQLFQGLDYLHSKGIMHRDIKPYNILINPQNKSLKIIDLGLSEYYIPGVNNNDHVASLYYKAPELLFGNAKYDYRVDIWGAGMIMAGMIFKKTPFIQGNDLIDQVLKITKLLGTKETINYIKSYKLAQKKSHNRQNICFDILVAHENGDIAVEEPTKLDQYKNNHNENNCTWEALDLLNRLLTLDFSQRFTAKQALQHPFFE